MENDFEPNGEKEEEESIVVTYSYTIVDPRAMVVESLNTLVASVAVTRTGSSYN